MSSFQDMQSAMLSDDLPNVNSQPSSPGLNDQDMEFSCLNKEQPVSNMELSSSGSNIKKVTKSYVCDVCKISCSRKSNLKQHMLTHSGEKPISCDVCEMPFARKSDFKRHRLSHLKIPTQHKCDKCEEMFVLKCDLLKHRKIHSKPTAQYNCDQCSEVFGRKYDLLKHGKIHTSPKQYKCDQCNEVFSRKKDELKHAKTHKSSIQHKCDHCNEVFSRKYDFLNHAKTHKSPKQHKCVECSEAYNSKSALLCHIHTFHARQTPKRSDPSIKAALYEKVKQFPRQNALGVFTKTKISSVEENEQDFIKFFDGIRPDVFNELTYQMEEKKRFKWYAVVQARLTRVTEDGETETVTPHFHSNTTLQLTDDNLPSAIEEAFSKITRSYEEFTRGGSGWTLERILNLELSTAKF